MGVPAEFPEVRTVAPIISKNNYFGCLPIFFPADFKPVERARGWGHDIAAQDAEPLPRLYQFLVSFMADFMFRRIIMLRRHWKNILNP
jgi:hypothetical protein